jgi:IclR family acetate operon transcriptional repressor
LARKYPLHAGAASKALLAFLPKQELDAVLADVVFERFQPSTAATQADLQAQLAQVRKTGVAVSFAERVVGAAGVAAPVISAASRRDYALSVYGPENRIRPVIRELIEIVREAALRASRAAWSPGQGGNHEHRYGG